MPQSSYHCFSTLPRPNKSLQSLCYPFLSHSFFLRPQGGPLRGWDQNILPNIIFVKLISKEHYRFPLKLPLSLNFLRLIILQKGHSKCKCKLKQRKPKFVFFFVFLLYLTFWCKKGKHTKNGTKKTLIIKSKHNAWSKKLFTTVKIGW